MIVFLPVLYPALLLRLQLTWLSTDYHERRGKGYGSRSKHGSLNPYSHLQKAMTIEECMESPLLAYPTWLSDVCPRTDGAAAVIFANEKKAGKLCSKPAWVWATAVGHDAAYFADIDFTKMPSLERATREAYKQA